MAMAERRWSERGGEHARGTRRRRGLGALLAALTMLGACSGDRIAAPPSPPGRAPAPRAPGVATAGTGISMEAIIGTWRNVDQTDPTLHDLQGVTTTWHFGAAGDCSRTIATVVQFDSILSTIGRTCRWVFDGSNNLVVTFDGDARFPEIQIHLFVDVASGILVLDDVVFERVA
jgi:hypothetical protein